MYCRYLLHTDCSGQIRDFLAMRALSETMRIYSARSVPMECLAGVRTLFSSRKAKEGKNSKQAIIITTQAAGSPLYYTLY